VTQPRKGQSDGEAAVHERRRREGRGWGPFSGGQLTIILVTLIVMMLFPLGAWAALSFTNVSIIDPGGVHRATVNVSGQLSTSAAVTGSVTATPTPPNASYTYGSAALGLNWSCVTPAVPAGKALVVTSITVRLNFATGGPVEAVAASVTPGSPCKLLNLADRTMISGAGVSQVIPFASGFPVKPGHAVGLLLESPANDANAQVVVHGYLVSSTLCTVTGPPVGCN